MHGSFISQADLSYFCNRYCFFIVLIPWRVYLSGRSFLFLHDGLFAQYHLLCYSTVDLSYFCVKDFLHKALLVVLHNCTFFHSRALDSCNTLSQKSFFSFCSHGLLQHPFQKILFFHSLAMDSSNTLSKKYPKNMTVTKN